jgi:cyclopropane-fatty-acyl-phospholipid synthase
MALGRDPLRLAEVYFRDEVDIEGDFFAALGLKDHLRSISMSWRDRIGALVAALRLCLSDPTRLSPTAEHASLHGRSVKCHSKTENRDAIAFHYDVSNEFYKLWLDQAMVYSCAYFENADDDLDRAQQAKLDHVCRKLLLQPGERLLDVGCGWGALVIHAAKHYGVRSHGITLSTHQMTLARERIAQAGLQDRVTVELRDYRDLPEDPIYDKVSSIGMFEHIGLKNLPLYFAKVHQVLKPGGLFLNHGITHDVEGWEKTLSSEFINRYVFPDGQLDTVSNIQRVMERTRFEIADVESLRPHYALTLRHWVMRLEQHHEQALQYVSESTWRVWRLYMAACALEFESGEIGVYQVLASKRAGCAAALPLTRQHLYMPSKQYRLNRVAQ